ncbi:13501_t:CDS:2 [Ambispora leptoticha]|uniref:13501_t:CDS:1 n=1 Tax=Ambispora leptoticha TaxID=144679 RepID=A0A9N9GMH3_9GLOM|nr:13501_t:CDS:2 [Ambispora leptoticha]
MSISKITTAFDFDNIFCDIRPSYKSNYDYDAYDFSILNPIMKIFKDGNAKWVKDTRLAKDIENWLSTRKIAPKYLFELLLDKHFAGGYWYMAACYEQGVGTKQDFKLAVQYYQKSFDMGCFPAALYLAKCYRNGIGVDQDIAKAFHLTLEATKCQFGGAYTEIGRYYSRGRATIKDVHKAIRFFRLGIENEDDEAYGQIVKLFYPLIAE